jgi:uncharacterized protein YlxW (UPF0749 family)
MLASKQAKLLVAFVSCILGFMIATQLRSVANIKAAALPYQRVEDLTEQLKRMEKERSELLLEVEKLRAKSSDAFYAKELQRLGGYAGTVKLQGPGVVVTIDDSKRQSKPGDNPNLYLIHDDDLLKVINELKAAGAEALSINGQRIIAISEIRCAGPTLSVNNVRSSPPYVIKAIGDPQTLDAALKMRGGVVETLKFWGIQVQAATEQNVIIPAYKGAFSFEYAKPLAEGN